MTEDLIRAQAERLHARLCKEARRGDPGTAGVGGLTKVGIEVEALLEPIALDLARRRGIDLAKEMRRRGVGKGPGTYLHFIREWCEAGPSNGLAGAIVRDASAGQHLDHLASIRRRNVHPGEPSRSIATTLSEAANWLGEILGADPL